MAGIDVSSVATGDMKFSGICSAAGKIYAAPLNSSKMLVYDPASKEIAGIDVCSVANGDMKFAGICSAAGKIFAAPFNSSKILVYDPVTQEVAGIDASNVATGERNLQCCRQNLCSTSQLLKDAGL